MALHKFNFANLAKLDPRVVEAFDQGIKAALADIEDRPREEKPRKLTLTVELTPAGTQDGHLLGVVADFGLKKSFPSQLATGYSLGLKADGAVFSDESPHNVQQLGFGFNDDDPKPTTAKQAEAHGLDDDDETL